MSVWNPTRAFGYARCETVPGCEQAVAIGSVAKRFCLWSDSPVLAIRPPIQRLTYRCQGRECHAQLEADGLCPVCNLCGTPTTAGDRAEMELIWRGLIASGAAAEDKHGGLTVYDDSQLIVASEMLARAELAFDRWLNASENN